MRRCMQLVPAVLLSALVGLASTASAQPVINVGDHVLQPNQAGQAIQLFVSGGTNVSELNLLVQVGDGGPELIDWDLPPGTPGPHITSMDVKTGTIFASRPETPVNLQEIPQLGEVSFLIETPGITVPASGLLATVYLDTTGFTTGTWDLRLTNILDLGNDLATKFGSIAAQITNGSITIGQLLEGDFDASGSVGAGDLNLVLGNWGQGSVPAEWVNFIPAGIVGATELNAVLGNWGASGLAEMDQIMAATGLSEAQVLAMIPEPASLALLSLGGLMVLRRRRVAA